ncbi:DUF1573 domain-containing protein [Mucilaginibacter phyllosphaerae]|uniref:DUF1573 domain-containing protein n=1 Tax=Mucilaginibacter phyllosphaerae TaxID=1812349 RepID=A0A4Y8ADB1_9SPHI|nr:DUF1573 domain-containing protein [Mucilaginibacter phyllosphaerae]MBB3969151.1 hypothetical protein [Mucilaginibacter phyllosphaerae]TEW66039.1 DUF1573 domain-containing protein [Mucilaginibacter phyllosphaerae]GGH06628.1 hypothetical protein GCM10007352_10940 [Mucilaginibacter phyllosphaerae]
MKKILLICAVVLGFAYNASAQTDTKPEFKFNEEKHDFGKIPQGTPVTTVFEFTNVGVEPLILTEVKPTCGCTIADYTKTPVLKGAKGNIKITYNAAAAQPFNKTIVVTSNAKTPTKYLNIVGEVIAKTPAASK